MLTDVQTKKEKVVKCREHLLFKGSLDELHALIAEMKQFLANNKTSLVGKDTKAKIESLSNSLGSCKQEHCTELPSALAILVADVRDRIKLAVEESERFEDEGGQVADRKQSAEAEELVKILRELDQFFPAADEICPE
ncbi:MAG: hypothetical protein EB060_04505 [Proteobacteria bacterium]|nr:hypothetical protein [Pseudomonadota bacterium]